MISYRLGLLAPSLLLLGGCFTVSSDLTATPQRPTISSNTNTTAEDSLEVEAGLAIDEAENRSLPVTVKYGAGPATEVFASFAPWQYVGGLGEQGYSDLGIGLRHRFWEEEGDKPAFAVQSSVELPFGDEERGLGNGQVDAAFAAIADKSFGDIGATGFYSLGFIGAGNGTNVSHTLTVAGGMPLATGIGAFAEVAGFFVPEANSETGLVIAGLTYSPEPAMVFDVGIAVGLDDEIPDWQLLIGVTRNFGRSSAAQRTGGTRQTGLR